MVVKTAEMVITALAVSIVLLTTVSTAMGQIIFVDVNAVGANNGSSWINAYNYLQDALAAASVSDEIRVAEGVYKPDQGTGVTSGDRYVTFQLINGVTVKGAYAGFGEPDPNARDIGTYVTILSGDLDSNDVEVSNPLDLLSEPSRAENSYHVVTSSGTDETTMLDGFTITAGNANDPCSNDPNSKGGGMFNDFGDPTITNCIITGNSAYSTGGGIFCFDSNSTIANCTISGNTAGSGGGICYWESNLTVTDYKISGNWAEGGGGGVFASGSNFSGYLTAINCTFSGNAATRGGAIYCDELSHPSMVNCILWADNATYGPEISMTTLDWGSHLSISFSNVQGGQAAIYDTDVLDWGPGNIAEDPCFIDPGYWDPNGTPGDPCDDFWVEGDDYNLLPISLCIDAGDPNYAPGPDETDLDGNPRIINGIVDMGAYEFGGLIYVDDDAPNDPGPGDPGVGDPLENGTEEHPFDTIEEGIDVSRDGQTVFVWPGLYLEPAPLEPEQIDFNGKNITLTSADPTDPNIAENTVIRGIVQFDGTEDANCALTGFTISEVYNGVIYGNNTNATISYCIIRGNGPCGATVIYDCHGTISNCLITDNTTLWVCGVYPVIFGCHGLIKNCTIANNDSGISVSLGGTTTIENCIIYNNTGSQIDVDSGAVLNISYSDIEGGIGGITGGGTVNEGQGNIDADPCFVRLGYWDQNPWPWELSKGNYHLKSSGHRLSEFEYGYWIYDDVTSRCIDAGNPGSALGDELMNVPRDPDNDWGINLRINMGIYGGMAEASMGPPGWALLADLNNDGIVNFVDFSGQAQDWLTSASEQPGDVNRDGVVDIADFVLLANDWMQETNWVQ